MNFSLEYTEEQEEFAREVREWLEENLPKDLGSPIDPRKMSDEQRHEFVPKLAEKGWLFPGYPREYGGGGLDIDHRFVLNQELIEKYWGLLPPGPAYSTAIRSAGSPAIPILAFGTEEQKKDLVPPILKCEVVIWWLLTEPEAGTDVANQQTNALRAVREGDCFILNGQKIFVGKGTLPPDQPDQLAILARSDLEAPRHQNLAYFIVPANLPGITIEPDELFITGAFVEINPQQVADMGNKYTVFFDDVRVHESSLIGGERDGWNVVNAGLEVEHSGGGGQGIARNIVVDKFLDQCKRNPNVVKRLKENPELMDSVVDVYISAQIERLWILRSAWQPPSGRQAPYTGPQLELYSKMFGSRLISDMAKVLGPYAFTDDSEWELGEGILELGQRYGLAFAPRGTPEAIKTIISRALAIGR